MVFQEKKRSILNKSKLYYLGLILVLILIFWFGRFVLLRGIGNFLISEDKDLKTECAFVLGGASRDRSKEAGRIYKDGLCQKFVSTGGVYVPELIVIGDSSKEAECTAIGMIRQGIPENKIYPLLKGSSTKEEAEAILEFSRKEGFKKIMILSSRFHTKRIRFIFTRIFKNSGIEIRIHGAPSQSYEEGRWWHYESGLIMVNNEYLKLIYYFFKY